MEPITSTQNTKVKLANALLSRTRTRKKEGKIVLEGVRLVRDAWLNGAVPEFVLHTPGTDDEFTDKLARTGVDVSPVNDEVMRYVTDTQSPQGVVGVFPMPQPAYPADARRVLVLDAISDPGNLGTIMRTAAGAGIDVLVLAPGSVDAYNPKVLRSAMGAHFRLPVMELSWEQIGEMVQVDARYLADGSADVAYDTVDWAAGSWALVIGSEAHGAGNEARQFATTPITILMERETESLNAAIATGVILFEAARQHRQTGQ